MLKADDWLSGNFTNVDLKQFEYLIQLVNGIYFPYRMTFGQKEIEILAIILGEGMKNPNLLKNTNFHFGLTKQFCREKELLANATQFFKDV